MTNQYGLNEGELDKVRERDKTCVYCHKDMLFPYDRNKPTNSATIEHLNHLPPWNNIKTVAMCCGSCNSSRGALTLPEWFEKEYCKTRDINSRTVAGPVKKYLKSI